MYLINLTIDENVLSTLLIVKYFFPELNVQAVPMKVFGGLVNEGEDDD